MKPVIIFMIFYTLLPIFVLYVIFVGITSCASVPRTQFNSNDKQDQSCYKEFGSELGYCDGH